MEVALAPHSMPTTGRPCTICNHADRAAIDGALVAAGVAVSQISRRFAVTPDALARHRQNHMPTLAMSEGRRAAAVVEAERGAGLADQADQLRATALRLLAAAEAAGDLRTALQGVREAARCLELVAKLTGEIEAGATVNVLVAPAIITLQATIIAALAPYPDARAAVARALGAIA